MANKRTTKKNANKETTKISTAAVVIFEMCLTL